MSLTFVFYSFLLSVVCISPPDFMSSFMSSHLFNIFSIDVFSAHFKCFDNVSVFFSGFFFFLKFSLKTFFQNFFWNIFFFKIFFGSYFFLNFLWKLFLFLKFLETFFKFFFWNFFWEHLFSFF